MVKKERLSLENWLWFTAKAARNTYFLALYRRLKGSGSSEASNLGASFSHPRFESVSKSCTFYLKKISRIWLLLATSTSPYQLVETPSSLMWVTVTPASLVSPLPNSPFPMDMAAA